VRPARVSSAVLLAVVVAALGWLGLDRWTRGGGTYVPLPWTAVAGTAALAVAVVAAGLPVRRWVTGRRDRPLDPLVAARTVVLAKAAAYGGALLAGWYAAQALVIVPDLVGVRRTRFLLAVAATVAAAGVAAAGFVVQRWCRVPPEDDDPDGGDGRGSA
jgi:hypothetical protein